VATAGGGISLELSGASLAVVDEDRSALSSRIVRAFRPPYFRTPEPVPRTRAERGLASGAYTFVLEIPPGFEGDVRRGRRPALQLLVDATAVSQAYLGSAYVREIVGREVAEAAPPSLRSDRVPPVEARVRIRYNPNREGRWYQSVLELLFVAMLLSVVLPAAAMLRERDQGTLEQLLALPLGPAEIMLSKIWPNAVVILLGVALSLGLIIRGWFDVPIRGSLGLFFVGTLVYQFTTAGLGIALSTIARSASQVALLSLLVVTPMMFLSGAWTPAESMPKLLQAVTFASPFRYYADLTFGIFFRGATLRALWPQLAALALIGAGLFALGAARFRGRLAAASR
jgi:ABC-2 type transport system permease protein